MASYNRHFLRLGFGLLLAALAVRPVFAQFSAHFLPVPAGHVSAAAAAGIYGQEAGSATPGYYQNAFIWNNQSGSQINLNRWTYGSAALSAIGGYQGGYANVTKFTTSGSGRGGGGSRTYLIPHAMLWNGSAGSATDLNPPGMYESAVQSIGSHVQVGWAKPSLFGSAHAFLWKDKSSTAVDINPATCVQSWAAAVSGGFQGGYGYTTGYAIHALLWSGTSASAVDLHPTALGANASYVYAVDAARGQQVGAVEIGVPLAPQYHACLWKGTAASALDLNPSGCTASEALAVRGGLQAGYGTISGHNHALLWRGTAASALDLHAFLPSNYIISVAQAIDPDGSVVGYANDGLHSYPVIWEPKAISFMSATQDVVPGVSGWANQTVHLILSSPYSTTGASIVYSVNGGAPIAAPGDSAVVTLHSSASFNVSAYGLDGLGARTAVRLYTANVDVNPPTTALNVSDFWLSFLARDQGSGVATTYFTLDGATQALFSKPILLQNVTHSVQYWSVDFAGNVEAAHSGSIAAIAPTLSSISPNTILSSSPGFTMLVTGNGFIANSVVNWNGVPLATTYLSPTQVQAAVPAANLANAGSAMVTVTNPTPGTGTSGSLKFLIPQIVVAIGPAANISDGGAIDISPVASSSGFVVSGNTVHVVTSQTGTAFLASNGSGLGYSGFYDIVQDNQMLKITGSYDVATKTLNAQIVQMQ